MKWHTLEFVPISSWNYVLDQLITTLSKLHIIRTIPCLFLYVELFMGHNLGTKQYGIFIVDANRPGQMGLILLLQWPKASVSLHQGFEYSMYNISLEIPWHFTATCISKIVQCHDETPCTLYTKAMCVKRRWKLHILRLNVVSDANL